jgi:hypothetical protein
MVKAGAHGFVSGMVHNFLAITSGIPSTQDILEENTADGFMYTQGRN